jgi:general secretion pathway protein G
LVEPTLSYKNRAFTILEVILVLIVLSILSAIILPKFSMSKKDAQLSKVRADIASIRMGILLYKNKQLLNGKSSFPKVLDFASINIENEPLFNNGVLSYPIYSISEDTESKFYSWAKVTKNIYRVFLNKIDDDFVSADFVYEDDNGTFNCDYNYANCKILIQ